MKKSKLKPKATLGGSVWTMKPQVVILVLLASMFVNPEPLSAALVPNLFSANDTNKPLANIPAVATPEENLSDLKGKLDGLETLRDRLDKETNDTKAPEGVKPEEVSEQRRLIESLIFFYQEGLNSLTAKETEQENLKVTQAQSGKWTGFSSPPPYSMLMLYGLQEESEALRGKQAVLESSLAGGQGDSASLQKEVTRAQVASGLASENVGRDASSDGSASAAWRREFAELRVRTAERNVWFREIQTGLVNAKLAGVRAKLALLDKQIALARQHAVLSESDMGKIREGLKTSTRNIEQDQQKAVSENIRWTKEREAVTRDLMAARAVLQKGTATGDPVQMATLEAQSNAADAWVAVTRQETETLGTLSVFNNNIEGFWNYQYTLQNSPDPKLRQDALNQLVREAARLQQWGAYSQDNLSLAVSEEQNQQAKLNSISIDSPIRRYETQTLDAYRLNRQIAERIRLLADRTGQMLDRWLQDYHQASANRPVAERFHDGIRDAANILLQVFSFELFTVDDEVDLEGKKLNITRGVTLGKSLKSLTVFVIGFWIAKKLARRFQRMLVEHFAIDEAQSNVLRRWVLMGLSSILLVIVLSLARIPMTAFAFLGGALAIGVGFGTQTMLKNLISGVMILVERKIQIGDIVEVDGILGTVTEIDIRSSTVRGFDGVETMIPNSTFLENKVTNWTYTNLKIRRSVRVGVAYGSPTREVIQLLLDCAQRHGQVLDDPKPYVWLEDFGDNSLVFGLYFWLEMGPKVSSLQMMSDLRLMMIDALGKAGIAIPFPQRDIHFIPIQPLPVSVVACESAVFDTKPGSAANGKTNPSQSTPALVIVQPDG